MMNRLFPTTLFLACFLASVNLFAQPQAGDVNEIVTVDYPPLTEREGKGLNIPIPPQEHPRLMFRKKDIPALKEKVSHPLMNDVWQKITAAAARPTDGLLPTDDRKQNIDHAIREAIEAKALLYAFNGDKQTGREAIDALINFYATLRIDLSRHDICRLVGRVILTGSMVYDWCYDLLTAEEKQLLIARMETLAVQGLEVQWPKLVQGSVTGHGSEAQLARDMLACGIATYDEKPEIYNLAAGRIIAEFVPARKYFYPAGYHHQGSAYGGYRFIWDMWATYLFDRMGYAQIFGPDQVKVPYRLIYMRRPDGQLLRDGDDYIEGQLPFGTYWHSGGDMMAGSYFNDPILLGEAVRQGKIGSSDYLFDYLFFNTDVEPQTDKSSLPLTRYFPEPLGAMIARTGWDEGMDAHTVVAEMKIGVRNYANHQHLDAGSFQLYYKGPLAPESGIYEGGKGAYGSEHFKNYYQRTIAHNSLLIYNPDEKFTWQRRDIANDGGQLFANGAAEPRNLEMFLANDYETGEVIAHHFGPDPVRPEYSYIKGDVARAYSDKVRSVQRSFVFLNMGDGPVPAALIVFDRIVSGNPDFRKTFLLHTVQEPAIDGNTAVVVRTEKGYNGKMVNTTLLPEADNLEVRKIGGPGHEFEVAGVNYEQTFRNPGRNSMDSAMWRLEISPRRAAETDHFLNVMQVMEAGKDALLEVQKIDAGDFTGVRVGDRLVFFRKDGAVSQATFSLDVALKGSFKILITDVDAGTWSVKAKNRAVELKDAGKGVLYFEGGKGKYVVARQ